MENFKPKKEATDLEKVSFWIGHIEKPCQDTEGNNLRQTYIDAAKTQLLPTLTDPIAKKIFELILQKYNK